MLDNYLVANCLLIGFYKRVNLWISNIMKADTWAVKYGDL